MNDPLTDSTSKHACDRVHPSEAAAILHLGYPGRFNRIRRLLQRVWDRDTGTHLPYPADLGSADETDFNRQHVLVVPEWGGIAYFGGDWSYSRARVREWASGRTLD